MVTGMKSLNSWIILIALPIKKKMNHFDCSAKQCSLSNDQVLALSGSWFNVQIRMKPKGAAWIIGLQAWSGLC